MYEHKYLETLYLCCAQLFAGQLVTLLLSEHTVNLRKKKKEILATRKPDTMNIVRNTSQHTVFLDGQEYFWEKIPKRVQQVFLHLV